jgi:hypothetical protein
VSEYGYRDYAAETGKWTRRDPAGERAHNNLTLFAANNAIGLYDLLGLTASSISIKYLDTTGTEQDLTENTAVTKVKINYDGATKWGNVDVASKVVFDTATKCFNITLREEIHIHKSLIEGNGTPEKDSILTYIPHIHSANPDVQISLIGLSTVGGRDESRYTLREYAIAHERGHAEIDIKYIETLRNMIRTLVDGWVLIDEAAGARLIDHEVTIWQATYGRESGTLADKRTYEFIGAQGHWGNRYDYDERSGQSKWMWH